MTNVKANLFRNICVWFLRPSGIFLPSVVYFQCESELDDKNILKLPLLHNCIVFSARVRMGEVWQHWCYLAAQSAARGRSPSFCRHLLLETSSS